MKTAGTFSKVAQAWVQDPRYIDCGGGARSGKTFSILQLLSLVIPSDAKPTINSVVSETGPHLSRGAIRDFKEIMAADGRWDDNAWNRTQNIYTFPNGSILEFFSADQPGKVLGPARDRLFINEANNVGYETARQLIVRTRGLVIWDYNPVRAFWAHEHYQPRENCISIHSTYKDNGYLTPQQVQEIESYKSDERWWRVYGEGLVGTLDGLIYDFTQIDEMPDPQGLVEVYGLDFGFTNDPTAIVRLLVHTGKREVYLDEVTYKTGLTNDGICRELSLAGVQPRTARIYADCAEPKSIAEIASAGFVIVPCTKDAPVKSDKMKFQIDFCRRYALKVTKRSTNVIKELRNYTFAKDKDGNALNTPIDAYNHSLDAMRYALFTHFAKTANYGHYTISVR